jgi:hypothetical protein
MYQRRSIIWPLVIHQIPIYACESVPMHSPVIRVTYVAQTTLLSQVEGLNVLKNLWAAMALIKEVQQIPVISKSSV